MPEMNAFEQLVEHTGITADARHTGQHTEQDAFGLREPMTYDDWEVTLRCQGRCLLVEHHRGHGYHGMAPGAAEVLTTLFEGVRDVEWLSFEGWVEELEDDGLGKSHEFLQDAYHGWERMGISLHILLGDDYDAVRDAVLG